MWLSKGDWASTTISSFQNKAKPPPRFDEKQKTCEQTVFSDEIFQELLSQLWFPWGKLVWDLYCWQKAMSSSFACGFQLRQLIETGRARNQLPPENHPSLTNPLSSNIFSSRLLIHPNPSKADDPCQWSKGYSLKYYYPHGLIFVHFLANTGWARNYIRNITQWSFA